jgi:diguanylate cyclase (GGDEF)-like protein
VGATRGTWRAGLRLAVLFVTATVIASATSLGGLPPWPERWAMPAALFVALHALSRRYPISLLARNGTCELTAAPAFGFAALLTAPLPVAVLGLTLAALVPVGRGRRPGLLRLVEECATTLVVYGSAGLVLDALTPVHGPLAGGWTPAFVMIAMVPAGLTAAVVELLVSVSRIAAAQGASVRSVLRQDRRVIDLPSHLLVVALAPVVVVVAQHSLLLTPLLFLTVVALYRASTAASERQHQSLHDALTGLPNRRMLDRRLAELVEGGLDDGFALLLLDLDRFKEVNDKLGHQLGDQLLAEAGARMAAIEGFDTAARLGGDEFAFIVRGVSSEAELLTISQQLVHVISRPYVVQDLRLSIGASVGIATFPSHGLDAATLLKQADTAMYSAKRSGVGVGVAAVRNETGLPGRLSLVGELEDAIRTRQLRLHYQPKVAIASGEVVGVECLLRWQHPTHGLVPPSAFVETVEHTELIGTLTRYVIDQVLEDAARWTVAGEVVPFAVNISGRDLQDTAFARDLADRLEGADVDPRLLTLEITENALLGDSERAIQVLGELTDLGVELSIDDFGTGYSSLAALRRLPVREVKIDRSFVVRMEHDEADAAIVRSVVGLGHALGLRVVAEGVEEPETLRELAGMGCDVVQGYLVSRPLPTNLVAPWVRARRAERERGPVAVLPHAAPRRRGAAPTRHLRSVPEMGRH